MNSLVKNSPFVFPNFDRLVSQLVNDPFFGEIRVPAGVLADVEEGTLALDLSEDDSNVFVRASLPGFKKEDVEISVHDGVLSIKAEHSEETVENKERFYRRERRFGSVSRRIALPSAVLDDKTSAALENGVLTLTLPKVRKEEPRRIAIK